MPAPPRPARRAASLLAVLLAATPGALCGCGGSSDSKKVRETLAQFQRATARGDYQAFCGLLSAHLTAQFTAVGLSCENALARAFAGVQEPRVSVGRIEVKGSTAMAQVHSSAVNQAPSDDTLALVKERGQWRVATLAAPQRPPARRVRVPHPPALR